MKSLIIGGICCGTVLCIASSFQQAGLGETDAGKASFITALYIVLVPLLGVFFRRRTGITTAISVAIAVAGMYLLCIGEGFSIQRSDLLVLICALCFALHILVIDYFAPSTDGIALSLVQFIVCGIESGILMIIFERPSLDGIIASLGGILYVGIFSSGVAYTLQIVGQKYAEPTVASIVMSLESVFGALAGALILFEFPSLPELAGCALMFTATLISQLPERKR
jgi:drug/metabolite transporter (DMT)-like permease